MDKFLVGNGKTCPECEGSGFVLPRGVGPRCRPCGGSGRVGLSEQEVVDAHLAEKRAQSKKRTRPWSKGRAKSGS